MKKLILFFLFYIFSISTAYAQLFYCPNTSRYINLGDSEQQVTEACGEPANKQTGEIPRMQTLPTEQWFYSLGSNQAGSSQVKVVFTIKNNQVSQILLDNQKVQSISLCSSISGTGEPGDIVDAANNNSGRSNRAVGIGASAGSVRSLCGEPSFANKTTESVQVGTDKGAIWYYDFGSYQAKIQLEFTNGKLISIKNR